jgi:hypothetical protein
LFETNEKLGNFINYKKLILIWRLYFHFKFSKRVGRKEGGS